MSRTTVLNSFRAWSKSRPFLNRSVNNHGRTGHTSSQELRNHSRKRGSCPTCRSKPPLLFRSIQSQKARSKPHYRAVQIIQSRLPLDPIAALLRVFRRAVPTRSSTRLPLKLPVRSRSSPCELGPLAFCARGGPRRRTCPKPSFPSPSASMR